MHGNYNGKPIVPRDYEKDRTRFWAKVDIRTADECWPWTGSTLPSGYGNIQINSHAYRAHRVSWFFTFGDIPQNSSFKRLCVCHSCDNPACVNPGHLFLAPDRVNNIDCINKGRRDLSGMIAASALARRSKPDCHLGHPLSGNNLYINPRGSRVCKECSRAAKRRYRARLSEAMPGTEPEALINEVGR